MKAIIQIEDGIAEIQEIMVPDTTWQTDTVTVSPDSVVVVKGISQIGTRKESKEVFAWDKGSHKKHRRWLLSS